MLNEVQQSLSMFIEDLIISRVRVKLLSRFFLSPGEMYYVRQLVRATKEEINAVRRELGHMEKIGLLGKEKRGNRLYYYPKKDYPLYYDLLGLVHKTFGLGKLLYKNRNKIGKIRYAMLSGKFVRGLPRKKNEVDLLIVGEVNAGKIGGLIKRGEEKLKREINFTVMSQKEYLFRKKRNDPFVKSILKGERIMLIGDEEEMTE